MSIKHLIERDEFYHVYQPIFETQDWQKIGYEALLRTKQIRSPEDLFQNAKHEKQLYELDSRSIHKAVRTYFAAGKEIGGYLFINVFPSTILNERFPQFLQSIIKEKNKLCQQENFVTIVFEIIETESIPEQKFMLFQERIKLIKKLGSLIAIDDIGKGFNSLQLLIELQPNFIKLDRYFANNLFDSTKKMDIIKLLNNYCDQYNCRVILEGLENHIDLAAAKSIGIRFAQGFLLGRPGLPSTYF